MARIPFEQLSFAIIDDNAHIRRLLRAILHSFGSREIVEAEDGAAGLEMVEMHGPDIVILDLIMPMFDGFDFMQMVRNPKSCKNPRVPIIMLTGHAEKGNVLRARDLGVTEFMCKPFSAETLYQRIQSVVQHPREFVESGDYFGPAWRSPHDQAPGSTPSQAALPQPDADETADADDMMEIQI
jgi:CheY-like chemotaxis protein